MPLAALLVLSILMVAAAVALSIFSGVFRRAWGAIMVVGLALLGCTGLYAIGTARKFHETHAPRCPHCSAALPNLVHFAPVFDMLRDLEETVRVRPELFEMSSTASEKLSEAARLRCPHCNGIVAAPAV